MSRMNRYIRWSHHNWPDNAKSAWIVATRPGDVLSEGGPACKLTSRTVWNAEMAFGRYYEFLSGRGCWLEYGPLEACLQSEYMRAWAEDLGKTLAPYTVWALLSQVVAAIRLMAPQADLRDANRILFRLSKRARPRREIDSRLISPDQLVAIGATMMDEADEASQDLPVPSAGMTTMYRDGVLIMGAALCPIRLRNWRMAMIDVHLILEGDSARMHFSSDETKTKRELEFELPAEYVPLLRRYIDQYRPHLLQPDAADQGFLWPSSRGGMVHRNTLSRAIKDALVKRTGKRFTFHMFRHAAATFIADVAPERVGLAAGVLQHRRLSTTRRHYIRSRMRQAARGYQDAVKAVVRKARRRKAGQKKDD